MSDAGEYELEVSNATGKTQSNKAALAVVSGYTRLQAQRLGDTVTLIPPIAAGAAWLYSWQKGSLDVVNDSGATPHIQGATTRSLIINQAVIGDAGDYVCTIYDVYGNARSAGVVTLHFDDRVPALMPFELPTGAVGSIYNSENSSASYPYAYGIPFNPVAGIPGAFDATGLPSGLVLDPANGIISGIPTEPVVNRLVTITLRNGAGSVSETKLLTIDPLPVGLVGTFQGWVKSPQSDDPRLAFISKSARLELVTTQNGYFTGKLIAATSLPITGRWIRNLPFVHGNSDFAALVQIPVPGGWPLELALTQRVGEESLNGESW